MNKEDGLDKTKDKGDDFIDLGDEETEYELSDDEVFENSVNLKNNGEIDVDEFFEENFEESKKSSKSFVGKKRKKPASKSSSKTNSKSKQTKTSPNKGKKTPQISPFFQNATSSSSTSLLVPVSKTSKKAVDTSPILTRSKKKNILDASEPTEKFEKGDKVIAEWEDGHYYEASIVNISENGKSVVILFENGEEATISIDLIFHSDSKDKNSSPIHKKKRLKTSDFSNTKISPKNSVDSKPLLLPKKEKKSISPSKSSSENFTIVDNESDEEKENNYCMLCATCEHVQSMVICENCQKQWHYYCLTPKLNTLPKESWFCSKCITLLPPKSQPEKKNPEQEYLLLLSESNFSIDQLIWAKHKSFPWWPSKISGLSNAPQEILLQEHQGLILVYFLSRKIYTWLKPSAIRTFHGPHFELYSKDPPVALQKAIYEALAYSSSTKPPDGDNINKTDLMDLVPKPTSTDAKNSTEDKLVISIDDKKIEEEKKLELASSLNANFIPSMNSSNHKNSKEEESSSPGKANEFMEHSSSTVHSNKSFFEDMEFVYAFPTNIPSIVSKNFKYHSSTVSIFTPTSCCCLYCLKVTDNLYSFQVDMPISVDDEKSNLNSADYSLTHIKLKLFCSSCLDFLKNRKDISFFDLQVPNPSKKGYKMAIRYIAPNDLQSLHQASGGIMFWDSLEDSPIFKRVISELKENFEHWKQEWITHLAKNGTKVWSETIFSQFIDEDESLEHLSKYLLLSKRYLLEYIELLEKKRQVVFYGPPGTGKTFVAQELASYCCNCTGTRKGKQSVVQFHPTYSYEDFVEGYRPIYSSLGNSSDKAMTFSLVSGPLKELSEEAEKQPDSKFILIIDELNRGNVAKIFGELFYLLEYRGRSIKLQYGNKPFSLPPNLWIIATMNTFDRSLARLDRALRRRFFFIPFLLNQEPVTSLLSKWLRKVCPDMDYVDNVVKEANKIVGKYDETLTIGPSHFMTPELNPDWLNMIWKYAIVPEVEDAIEEEEDLKEFVQLPETCKKQKQQSNK